MPLWLLSPVEKIPKKRTFVLKAHLRAIFREHGRQRGGMWMKRRRMGRMGRMGREVNFILISISSSAVDHCHSYCQRLQLPGNVPSVPARSTVARGVEWSGSEGRWEDFPASGFVENCCHWISKNHTTWCVRAGHTYWSTTFQNLWNPRSPMHCNGCNTRWGCVCATVFLFAPVVGPIRSCKGATNTKPSEVMSLQTFDLFTLLNILHILIRINRCFV